MKDLIFLLYFGAFACAKPSYPIHPAVGVIYKGPNSETIIKGPDGSIITSEADGGAVALDSHNVVAEVAAIPVTSVAQPIISHQIYEQSAAAAAASAAAASQTISLSQRPIVVQESAVAVEPAVVTASVLVGKGTDTAILDGPSGSIQRHGENAVISGPSSTTIRHGNVITSIPKAEVNTIVVEPVQALAAAQAEVVNSALITPPAVSSTAIVAAELANVAEANAHLTDINLINEANIAAQISAANRQQLAAEVNAANAASLANEINSQAAIAEANRAAVLNANAINSAKWAHSQEAIARANLEAQVLAQANLEAQLAHTAGPQVTLADINAFNAAAAAAHSQEGLIAKASLGVPLVQTVTPQVTVAEVNAINSAAIAHSQEAIARVNLEAQLAAERNAIASQVASHNAIVGLNPIITQGNQIISEAIISSTPAPVVEVTPISTTGPFLSSTAKPVIFDTTSGYLVNSSPSQNIILSSTLKPISGIVGGRGRISVVGHPSGVIGPAATLNGEQVLYQSSSSSSRQAESHASSSSQSSSVNVVNGEIGGVAGVVGAPLVGGPVGISSSDYAQWQQSFSKSGHAAGESVLAAKFHRGVIH